MGSPDHMDTTPGSDSPHEIPNSPLVGEPTSPWGAAHRYAEVICELHAQHLRRVSRRRPVEPPGPDEHAVHLVILAHAITAAATSGGIVQRETATVTPADFADISLVYVFNERLHDLHATRALLTGAQGCAPHPSDPGREVYDRLRADLSAGGATPSDVLHDPALMVSIERTTEQWMQHLAGIRSIVSAVIIPFLADHGRDVSLGMVAAQHR